MWIRQCGATKGRLCPNQTETELYGGRSRSTKVQNDVLDHDSLVTIYAKLSAFIKAYYKNTCSPTYSVLLFSKGTHHLWSVPVLSFQDITYHFRVTASVSKPGPLNYRRADWFTGGRDWRILVLRRVKRVVPLREKPRHTPTTTLSFEAAACEKEDDLFHGTPRRCLCGFSSVFFWWDQVWSHYCTLFLKIFIPNYTHHCLHLSIYIYGIYIYAIRHLFLLWSLEFEKLLKVGVCFCCFCLPLKRF